MKILQHYYTSYINQETGSAGFQMKGMSPGISPDLQSIIARLISYRIPPTLDEHVLDKHPIALRYYYKGPDECIFLCSQSNGNDENGRPGNFFAHTLVMEPNIFTSLPPILYWKNSFWRKEDREARSRVSSLPILSTFDVEPSLDIDGIWSFLAQGNRRTLLYKLLCAVVHSHKTQRRIVILDSTENVVWWIAAVTCLLPPDYRPLLTFATYHHDPYQAQFLITGTTSDSSFRASVEEYMSYFILNAKTGVTSQVEDSPYAQMASGVAQADLYETEMLSLFTDYAQRFPPPIVIDEQLDLMVLYARIQKAQHQDTLTTEELQAVRIALSSFEQLRIYEQEDIDELRRLRPVLWEAFKAQQDPAIHTEYERVIALLKKHNIPTDEFVLDEVKYFTERLVQQREQATVIERFDKLRQAYGEEVVINMLNRPVYLQWLKQFLEKVSSRQLRVFWEYVGQYIQPEVQSQDHLVLSLRVLGQLSQQQRIEEADALMTAMWQAMRGQEQSWLQLATASSDKLPEGALEAFYYNLVAQLSLDQRIPYRKIVSAVSDNVLTHEISSDIYNADTAGVQKGLVELEDWIRHAQRWQYQTKPLIMQGLSQLQHDCSPQQWRELAPKILNNHLFAPLPTELEDQLATLTLSSLSLSQFSTSDIALYNRYQDRAALSATTRLVIAVILAITRGELDAELAQQLFQYVKTLQVPEYEADIRKCLREFFRNEVKHEAHLCLIRAFYTNQYASSFWQAYFEAFDEMLMRPSSQGKALNLLAFWFTVTPGLLHQRYIVQHFFLVFPAHVESLQKNRSFSEAIREFQTIAAREKWYPAIQALFTERKNAFTTIGQNLAKLPRLWINQNVDKDAEMQAAQEREARTLEIAEKVARLFDRKHVRKYHQYLPELYNAQPQEQFWSCYWEKFTEVLTSRDADLVLAVLSFWFDESFEALAQVPYVPQEFFLGLLETLTKARKERGFRETARQVNEKQMKERYNWYGLVKRFFSETEKGLK